MTKVLSFFLSILTFLFSTLSSVFPGLFPAKPIENNYEICNAQNFAFSEIDDTAAIISDYASWLSFADEESEIFSKYDLNYFFTGSLAVVEVELPNPGCEISIVSLKENGNTLEIDYFITYGDGIYPEVIVPKAIVVQVSKDIALIKLNNSTITPDIPEIPTAPEEPEMPEEPANPIEYEYSFWQKNNFKSPYQNTVITNLDELKEVAFNNQSFFFKYNNEEFFENHNLAVLFIDYCGVRSVCEVYSAKKYNGYMLVETKLSNPSKYYYDYRAIVFEVDKDIDYAYERRVGLDKGYDTGVLDYELLLDIEETVTFTNIEEYESFNEYIYSLKVNEQYFEHYDLTFIMFMIPDYESEIKVEYFRSSESNVHIKFGVYETKYSEHRNLRCVGVVMVETPKGAEVTYERTTFANYGYFYNSTLLNIEGCGDYMIVSDYESWCRVLKTDTSDFPQYDEEFFETASLVLKQETISSEDFDYRFLCLEESGNLLKAEYVVEYQPQTDLSFEEDNILLIEVSKNIDTATFRRNDNTNESVSLEWGTFGEGVYHDYETFAARYDITDERFAKYDEEYFETGSVAFLFLPTWNIGDEIQPIYAYENGDTLYVGYTYIFLGMFPSTSVASVMVETSKNISNVEAYAYH